MIQNIIYPGFVQAINAECPITEFFCSGGIYSERTKQEIVKKWRQTFEHYIWTKLGKPIITDFGSLVSQQLDLRQGLKKFIAMYA